MEIRPVYQPKFLIFTKSQPQQQLCDLLAVVAHRVTVVTDLQFVVRYLWDYAPDLLLILDTSADPTLILDLCHQVRNYYQTPILVLEEGATEEERIAWLDGGADDVLSIRNGVPAELTARCRALIQRAQRQRRRDPTAHRLVAFGMQLDLLGRILYLPNGQSVSLSDTLTRFLAICFVHGDAIVSTEELSHHIFKTRRSKLQPRLASLAQALDECTASATCPRPHLQFVRGNGYRLTLIPPMYG